MSNEIPITIRFTKGTKEALDKAAFIDKRSLNAEVVWIVEAYAKGELLDRGKILGEFIKMFHQEIYHFDHKLGSISLALSRVYDALKGFDFKKARQALEDQESQMEGERPSSAFESRLEKPHKNPSPRSGKKTDE